MASSSWSPTPETPQYPPAPISVANDLRPLSLGEVLDRTFALYRRNFWLFAGISAVSGAVQLLGQVVMLLLGHSVLQHQVGFRVDYGTQGGSVVVSLLFLLASAVTSAATIYAIGEVYLARPVAVGSALSAIGAHWLRYIGIMLWQIGSFIWIPLLVIIPAAVMMGVATAAGGTSGAVAGGFLMVIGIIGGGIGGFIMYLRNSLGVQASVVEQLPVRPSMRRSKTLTSGTKGRIFVVLLISAVLYLVAGVAQFPATMAVTRDLSGGSHPLAQAWVLLIGFLAHVLVAPIAMIGLSLIYFDQRIRMEAFDIAYMLGEAAPGQPVIDPAYAVPTYAQPPAAYPPPPAGYYAPTAYPAPSAQPLPPAQYDYTTAQPLPPATPAPEPVPPTPPPIAEPQPEPPPINDVPEP